MARKSEQIASLFASVGFQVDKKSIMALESSLTKVEKRLASITKSFRDMSGSKSLTGALRQTARDSGKATAGIEEFTSKLKSGVPAIGVYTNQLRILSAELRAVRGAASGGILPRVPSGGGTSSSGGSTPRGSAATGFVSGLFGGGAASFARGLLPGIGAGWAVAHATTRAREMLANEAALGALTGSQAAGAAEYNYLQNFSDKYGLRATETIGGYKRILASSVGTSLEGKGAKDIFEGTALYGKTLGLTDENMSRATTAISQMISKGKISSEELKGQLAEAIPGAVQIFARAMNVPVAQMFKMMENGEVLAQDVLPKVAKELERAAKAGGALEKQMRSSASAQARFVNAWERFLKTFFESGVDEDLAVMFNGLAKALTVLVPIMEKIGKVFRFAFVPIEGLYLLFKEMNPMLKTIIVSFLAFTAALFGWAKIMAVMSFLKANPLFIMLTLLFLLLEDLWVMSRGGKSALGRLGEALNNLIAPEVWDKFFGMIDAWIDRFVKLYQLIIEMKRTVSGESLQNNPNTPEAKERANRANKAIKEAQGRGGVSRAIIPQASAPNVQMENKIDIRIDGYNKDKRELAQEIEKQLAQQINLSFQNTVA